MAMTRASMVIALWASCHAIRAGADTNADVLPPDPDPVPIARPVIPIEDTRSHGPTARDWVDLAATPMLLVGTGGTIFQLTSQLAIGLPTPTHRELSDIYELYHLTDYQLRVRNEVFSGGGAASGGPMTLALQRYFSIPPLAISPLLYAHVGLEAAVSTPWLSGRFVTPPRAIQVLDGVDTELARDGWSVRPASAYVRGDFLACRSASIELGIEPEAFVPAVGAHPYGVRVHAAGGLSLGCKGSMSPHAPKIALEYRGRATLYEAGGASSYRDSLGAGVQLDFAWFVLQLLYKTDPGSAMRHYGAIGLRLQIGKGRE
jgi:hypothetical protein